MRAFAPALLVLVTAASSAMGQPSKLTPAQTIDKVEETYANAKAISATLEQTVTNSTYGTSTTSKATLIEDHGKFAADYTNKKDKLDKSFLFDGTDFWMVEHLGKKATHSTFAGQSLPAVLTLLSGTKGAIAKDFTIAAPKSVNSMVPGTIVVQLTPKQASASYATLDVIISPTTYVVLGVNATDPQGNTTSYNLTNVDLDAKIDAKRFTFDPKKYPTYQMNHQQTTPQPPAKKP